MTPTVNEVNYAGRMKKRKTKMFCHEWHENHFHLNSTYLAIHCDLVDITVFESIDVNEYVVAYSLLTFNKLDVALNIETGQRSY